MPRKGNFTTDYFEELEKNRQLDKKIQKELDDLKGQFVSDKDELISTLRNDTLESREKFDKDIEGRRSKFEEDWEEKNTAIDALITKANAALGITTEAAFSSAYQEIAATQGKQANIHRWVALAVLAVTVIATAVFIVWNYDSFVNSENFWRGFAIKTVLIAPATYAFFYLTSESRKHREREEKVQLYGSALRTMSAFFHEEEIDIDSDDQDELDRLAEERDKRNGSRNDAMQKAIEGIFNEAAKDKKVENGDDARLSIESVSKLAKSIQGN